MPKSYAGCILEYTQVRRADTALRQAGHQADEQADARMVHDMNGGYARRR